MIASYCKYTLDFNFLAITSRNEMRQKDTYFIRLADGDRIAYGEANLFKGLSPDDYDDYEDVLEDACREMNRKGSEILGHRYSSIRFGIETALADFINSGKMEPFSTAPINIPTNGLIWISDFDSTIRAVEEKMKTFDVIKIKVGRLDIDEELEILRFLRKSRPGVTIRLDANGAFKSVGEAIDRLHRYAQYSIHSLEQPIPAGRYDEMQDVIAHSPIDIALDEELIAPRLKPSQLLSYLKPRYLVLKPALINGFSGTKEWIHEAENRGIGWWITSALESNIGLNAIARFASQYNIGTFCQGLGTGRIYSNNIPSPLYLDGQVLRSRPGKGWSLPDLEWVTP
ncbi:MAG: o-succinylbenzoate synthase [Lachnoclostridium sp.]|nr:o-succinylbenzoate synthase [Lachnoclostridium sp.]